MTCSAEIEAMTITTVEAMKNKRQHVAPQLDQEPLNMCILSTLAYSASSESQHFWALFKGTFKGKNTNKDPAKPSHMEDAGRDLMI